jgi:hypothetical protein
MNLLRKKSLMKILTDSMQVVNDIVTKNTCRLEPTGVFFIVISGMSGIPYAAECIGVIRGHAHAYRQAARFHDPCINLL